MSNSKRPIVVSGTRQDLPLASVHRWSWPSKPGASRILMDLPRDLIDLFSVFDAASVRYLLVGGHAVSAHGRPRSTKDVDLWLGPERADIECACVALSEFGVPREIVEALRNSGPQDIVWLGRAPSRIDLLRSLPGVGFEAAWPRRVTIDLQGIRVPVIGKEDLIRNKLTVGRAQDRRDVRSLQSNAARTKRAATRKPKATRSRKTTKG
jgi:hypothetical protein